jgi:hypothetical protein
LEATERAPEEKMDKEVELTERQEYRRGKR